MKLPTLLFLFLTSTLAAWSQIPMLEPAEIKPIELSEQAQKRYEDKQAEIARIRNKQDSNTPLTPQEQQIASNYDELEPEYGKIQGEGCSWYCGNGYPTSIVASSALKPQGAYTYHPANAHDNDYLSVWSEGAKGYGIGEYIEYTFEAETPRITRIIVAGGHVKSPTAWRNNSRPKQLKLSINGTPHAILKLKDERAEQTFEFDPIGRMGNTPWTMRFEILDVYKGDKWDDVVIAEIYFSGIDVHCLAKGTPVRMANGTDQPIELIRVGDSVAYYHQTTKTIRKARVEEVAKKVHRTTVTYLFESGKSVTATKTHPFYIKGKGWASLSPYESMMYMAFPSVERIAEGDLFVTISGVDKLARMSVRTEQMETYTITRTSEGDNFLAGGFVVGVEREE